MVSLNHASQNTGRSFFFPHRNDFFKGRLYIQAKVGTFKFTGKCVTTHYLHLSSLVKQQLVVTHTLCQTEIPT